MKKEPEIRLDPAVADQMLSNIFDVCDYEGNTVPLKVLSSYKNYKKERNYLQRGIVTIILIALLLMPLLFITPDVSVEKVGAYGGKPAIWLGYHSVLPIREIHADLEGSSLMVHETKKGHFLVYPDKNGALEVQITLINGQSGRATIMVSNAEVSAPGLGERGSSGYLPVLSVSHSSRGMEH